MVVSGELVTRVESQDIFKSDFDLGFYDPYELDASVVETHVRAFFGEKLLKPRVEHLLIGFDGTLSPDYVAMMKRSINYWKVRGDKKATLRFEKELEGAENAVNLVLMSSKGGEPMPVVINASDPGDFYVDKNGNKKSVTFVWMFDETDEKGWKYNVYSLPTKYIGIQEHWDLLAKLSDLHRTEQILKHTLMELDANSLIAFPVLLNQLVNTQDSIAKELGYGDWKEVETLAENQLALENDTFAKDRREKIVAEFMARIFYAVKDRRAKKYKQALVAAMSDTMALEAGAVYYKKDAQQIESEIDKNVKLALALEYRIFARDSYGEVRSLGLKLGDLQGLYAHQIWVARIFEENQKAREARATGCGGSGIDYSQQNGWDLQSQQIEASWENAANLFKQQNEYESGLEKTSEASSTEEPEGRYSEGKYKPGRCRACNKDRKKVWHKKDGGCDCCTTCEHRLAGGD